MSASLVGSEMCIRDSFHVCAGIPDLIEKRRWAGQAWGSGGPPWERRARPCLLYTSDAADDM
eukprot:13932935-Alexandrium_andersonii.AAC.1